MTTVNVQGKNVTAIQVSNSLASYYATQAQAAAILAGQYKDEAQSYTNTVSLLSSTLDTRINDAKAEIEYETEVSTEAIKEVFNGLVEQINLELEAIIGDEV